MDTKKIQEEILKTENDIRGEYSDGYHTFSQLPTTKVVGLSKTNQ